MPSSTQTDRAFMATMKGFVAISVLTYAACSEGANQEPVTEAADVVEHVTDAPVTGEVAINALNGVFGRHAGERGSHAKGFCVAGSFEPAATAHDLTSAPIFAEASIPVTGRFSIGGGNPEASDKGRSVRGMGIRLQTDADILDLVMISAPVFFASTPRQFVEFLHVRQNDPETGQKNKAQITAFNSANPNTKPHLDYVSQTPPPASYASAPYFSTHAFMFEADEAQSFGARWDLRPVGGFEGLTPEQEENFPSSFLEEELTNRLAQNPAQWDAYLQLAQAGDDLDDPTAVWTEGREHHVNVGRLTIGKIVEKGSDEDCTGLIFDPNNLPEGVTATDDPILALRRPAYAVSFGRRVE